MEALLQSLAAKYGYDVAVKLLGIDKQQGNPKYSISLGGNTINPMNMLKRMGLNQGIKAITSGGSSMGMALPLLAGSLGLAYMRNPLREGSMNYNPYLKDQISFLNENNMINRNDPSGLLKYGDDSILSGQGVVSLFGTNNYIDQLEKYKDKYYDKMSDKRKDKLDKELIDARQGEMMQELEEEEKQRNRKNYVAPHHGQVHGNGGGNGGGGGGAADIPDRNRGGYATDDTASFFYKGGIASL